MIIKAKSRGDAGQLGGYLLAAGKNERVDVLHVHGTAARDVRGAVLEMEALAIGTKCELPLCHAVLSPAPGERLTPEQWERAADIYAAHHDLTGHPSVMVLHTKDGEQHAHFVVARIDRETRRAAHDGWNYAKTEEAAREIEKEFGLQRVQGVFAERELDSARPERTPEQWEMQQGERQHIDPRRFRETIQEIRQQCDNGRSFAAALSEYGVTLCQGDQRGFVLVDEAGGVHSLSRTLGKETKLKEFMAGIDRDGLPTGAEAREHLRRAITPEQHPAPEIEAAPELAASRAGAEEVTADHRTGPDFAEASAVWERTPEPTRDDELQQRREVAAAAIGQAWREAARDPVQFVIELGQRGLSLAEDDKGRFVAVDGDGYAHFLTGRALGEPARAVQEQLHDGLTAEGVSVVTVAEARAELKEERKAAWIEARKEERRAEHIQRQRDRHADNDTVQGIVADYLHHPDNAGFADALAESGIVLCRVSDNEAARMAQARDLAKETKAEHIPAAYEAGALLAVAHDGRTYRIDATTLYDSDEAIKARFADYDPGMTWTEAKDAQRAARRIERQEQLYDQRRDDWQAKDDAKRHLYEEILEKDYRPQQDALGDIGAAYAGAVQSGDFGAAFVAELERRDLLFVRVTEEEAEASRQRHEAQASLGRYAPEYEAGQYLAIDKSGRAYALDRSTIYDDPASIAANLAAINADEQLSLTQGREVMAFWRQQEQEEPRSFAHDSEDNAPGLAFLGNSAGRALGHILRSLGDVLEYFAGTSPAEGHAPAVEIEAAPEPEPDTRDMQRDTMRRGLETIEQDPH